MTGQVEAPVPAPSAGDRARARLEAAAVECFARNGFHGTSTRDIAAAAGMSPAAIYAHYPSKHEVLFRVSHRGHEEALAAVLDGAAAPGGPAERMAVLVRNFVGFHARHPTAARVVNYENGALTGEHREQVEALRSRIDAVVRALVEDGVAAGEFTVRDPRLATAAIVSLGIDVARWYDPDGGWPPDRLADDYAAFALRLLGRP